MKKLYSKPLVKKIYKGHEVHLASYKLYDEFNPLPDPLAGMTPEEKKVYLYKGHQVVILAFIPSPDVCADDDPQLKDRLQKLFDDEYNSLKKRYPGYSKDLLIKNWRQEFTEVSLDFHNPKNQIKANRLLSFLDWQEKQVFKSIINSKIPDSRYTVKSIILACYYMRKTDVYPIAELKQDPLNLENVHDILHKNFGWSTNSFSNDWNPIFDPKKGKKNRLTYVPNIKLAIELLETKYSFHPGINKSIEFAKKELQEAELKK